MTSPSQNGLYFQANDHVEEWLIPFLRSVRHFSPDIRLVMIPWDDRIERVSRLAPTYNFEILDIWDEYQDEIAFLDAEAARCFAKDSKRCPYLRCLVVFAGPLETFIFSDVDIVAMADFSTLLDVYLRSDADVMFLQHSPGYVYADGPFRTSMLEDYSTQEFNTGFWASRRGMFSQRDITKCIDDICTHREDFSLNGDQPILNYLYDKKGGSRLHFREIISDLSKSCWPHPERVGLIEQREKQFYWSHRVQDPQNSDKRLALLHWAGIPLSVTMPHWTEYARWRFEGMSPTAKTAHMARLWGQWIGRIPNTLKRQAKSVLRGRGLQHRPWGKPL